MLFGNFLLNFSKSCLIWKLKFQIPNLKKKKWEAELLPLPIPHEAMVGARNLFRQNNRENKYIIM